MLPLPSAWTCEAGLPLEASIQELWDSVVPAISGTGANRVCSSLPKHGPGEPVLVPRCCTSTYYFVDGPHGQGHGSRSRTGLSGRDFRDLGACLRRDTSDLAGRLVVSSGYVSILVPMGKSIVRLCSICM